MSRHANRSGFPSRGPIAAFRLAFLCAANATESTAAQDTPEADRIDMYKNSTVDK